MSRIRDAYYFLYMLITITTTMIIILIIINNHENSPHRQVQGVLDNEHLGS